MTTTFDRKVYIVTGAASGMGYATARLLQSKGARLALCDINQGGLDKYIDELAEQEKSNVLAQVVDVVDSAAMNDFLLRVKQHFGGIDGIASFAGTGGHALGKQSIWDTAQAEYDFIMDLNVKALYNILRISLQPGFLNTPSSIVHATSMYAERGFRNGAIFTASKYAANGMVQSAAIEVAQRGIRVNTVMPGVIDTPMSRAGRTEIPTPIVPMARMGLAAEVANVTAFLLGDEASYVTGSHYTVDGGANAIGRHE